MSRPQTALALATFVFLLPWPAAAQDQEPRIMGFLEVPQLFGGWTAEWQEVPREPGFQLILRADPSPDAGVVARITSDGMLHAAEFEYEALGARVFGRSDGWSLLRTTEGESGWVEPMEGTRFRPLEDHLLEGLTHLTADFDGFLFRTPGGGERVDIPLDPRRSIIGTLEPRRPTWVQIPMGPNDDPDSLSGRYRVSASSIRTRPDGTRILGLETGNVHPLLDAPDRAAEQVGEVATNRPSSTVFASGRSGMQGWVLVFDTRPGWFQVAREGFDWREAPRAWLQDDPDWTFHPVADPAEAEAIAEGAFGRRLLSVRVLEFARIEEDLWARVEVHFESPCFSRGEPVVIAEGWIPVHTTSGSPTVWFSPRGC